MLDLGSGKKLISYIMPMEGPHKYSKTVCVCVVNVLEARKGGIVIPF